MGACSSKTADEYTADLWQLIEKKCTMATTVNQVDDCILHGANIRALKSGRTMTEVILDQENRNRQAGRTFEAGNCNRVFARIQSKASELLIVAIKNGDFQDVQLLHKVSADLFQGPNTDYGRGLVASNFKELSLVKEPVGLLGYALCQGACIPLDLVRFLVANDVRNKLALMEIDASGRTPLAIARANSAQPDVIAYLQHQMNSLFNALPFDKARAANAHDIAVTWLSYGASMESVDESTGNSILSNAVIANNLKLVKKLVAAGAKLDHVNKAGQTPLQLAESASERNALLIAFIKTEAHNRGFHAKIRERGSKLSLDETAELIQNGADIASLSIGNDTPLHLAVKSFVSAEVVEGFVIELHANPKELNDQGYRALDLAIMIDDSLLVLSALLSLKEMTAADLFTSDKVKGGSKSILAFAHAMNREAAANFIQAELNSRLWNLFSAANAHGSTDTNIKDEATILFKAGAQINHLHTDDDHNAWSVSHLVSQLGSLGLIKFLQGYSAELQLCNGDGSTPLHLAAANGHFSLVTHYRELGFNLNSVNNEGDTALHCASTNKHFRVVRYLVLWGSQSELKNRSGQTALDLAKTATADSSDEELILKQLVHFLAKLDFASQGFRQESASAVSSTPVDLSTVDVCMMSVAAVVPALKHVGAEDEDPAGSISKGMLQGKPNSNLRSAVKKGQLSEAKAAIAEGADIRHIENGRSPLQEVRLAKEDNSQKASRADSSARAKYYTAVSNCQAVEDALIEIATSKMIEAITQGNEGRVAAYFNVGAVISPKCVYLSVTSSDNVAIIDFLVSKSIDCYNCLTDYTTPESPYVSASKANNMKVAQYIFSRLSTDLVKAVSENNFSRVQKLVRSGASVDSAGVQNIVVAVQHGNFEMVRFLCDNGCRFPQEWLDGAAALPIKLGSLKTTAEIQFYLQYKVLNRKLRLAAATGDFQTVKLMYNLGGDINAKNVNGSTALALCVQYLNADYVRVCHLLVSVGARMLHSNPRVKTLIHLANVNKSKVLEEYLSFELNGQFLASIQDGDLANAHSFAELGADFNAVDEQGRTALHYAVLLHGVDIVSWLCERGALLNIADSQGEYPITLAAMKGDYSSIEFIVKFNAGTKQLKNSAGFTALDLAKRSRYNRLVQLLDPGNPDFLVNEEDDDIAPPKYDLSTLVLAAKNGQFQVCQEFIDQRYASLTMKTDICRRMIEAAESKNQAQILAILKPHYKSLSSTAASDQTAERLVSASAQQKAILNGFLVSMSTLLGAGDVSLDLNDPSTYSQLFSNLDVRVKNRTEQLQKAFGDESGVQKIYQQDTLELQQKVMKLSEQMAKMNDSRTSLTKRLQAAEAQLAACKTAKEKKNAYAELQETKDQLSTLQSSVSLFVNAQKTATHKKKVLDSLKANTQLLCFYQTVENRLQGLFTACKAATAGMFVGEDSENAKLMTLGVELVGQVVTIVPVIGAAIQTVLVPAVSTLIAHLDKSRQQQEVRNITTLGNVEELDKAASNAAGLLTLYYHSQINAINMGDKIKSKDNPVVLAAEYSITWMIDALKAGEFVPGLPLADQLWFSVASRNPFDKKTIANRLGFGGPGAVKISLKVGVPVTLKNFYGCVAVAAEDGSIYSIEPDPADKQDMTVYGMTYLSAFASASMADQIIRKRQLKLDASRERSAVVVPSQLLDQISAFQTTSEVDHVTGAVSLSSSGSVTAYEVKDVDQKYVAHSIAAQLRQDGTIISEQQVRDLLAQQRSEMDVSFESAIAEVKEAAQEKANYYQTTADAAAEQAAKDAATLRKDFDTYKRQLQDSYAAALREQTAELTRRQDVLLQQQKEMFAAKEEQLTATVRELQKTLESTVKLLSDRLEATTGEALVKVNKAVASSNEAVALSQSLKAKTEETLVQTGLLIESSEKKMNEAKGMIETTARTAEAAINEAKAANAASLSKLQTKYTADLEKIRTAAEASSAAAKESAAAAKETSNASKEATRANKDQLALLQKELRDNARAMKSLERP